MATAEEKVKGVERTEKERKGKTKKLPNLPIKDIYLPDNSRETDYKTIAFLFSALTILNIARSTTV